MSTHYFRKIKKNNKKITIDFQEIDESDNHYPHPDYKQQPQQQTDTSNNCKSKDKKSQKNTGQGEKELLFGGGAGGMAYMMGYAHALVQIIGKEKLKEYKLGGVSAGGITALLLHLAIYQDKYDMKQLYYKTARRAYQKENKQYFGLFTTGREVIRKHSKFIFDLIKNKCKPLNDNLHLGTSIVSKKGIQSKVIDDITSQQQMTEALESTCNIPFLIKFGVFCKYQDHITLDGGISKMIPYRFEDSQKIFVNVLPSYFTKISQLFSRKQVKNIQYLEIVEGKDKSFPRDYFIWSAEWADETFEEGFRTAFERKQEIIDTFNNNSCYQDIHV